MSPTDVQAARKKLSLSVVQMAALLDTDPLSIRRMEMDADRVTARKLPPRAARLIDAYLAGYRPADWPKP